jgi:hypothetical protein
MSRGVGLTRGEDGEIEGEVYGEVYGEIEIYR